MKISMEPSEDGRASTKLEAYSDSDFAADKSDRKSLTGGIILLNGMTVGWSAKKQGGVSLSTMEAEFVAASETARELLGLREMLSEIGMAPKLPMLMHVDNQAAVRRIEGEASLLKAKYIDVGVNFVCDFAQARDCPRAACEIGSNTPPICSQRRWIRPSWQRCVHWCFLIKTISRSREGVLERGMAMQTLMLRPTT